MDYKFKTEPYEHQLQALGASHNKENFALLMEMGTGKSKVLVDNIAMLYDKGKIDSALIIAPKGVYRNWEKQEIPIHLPDHVKHQMIIWSPNKTKKQEKELNKLFKHEEELMIFIMNIEAFSTKRGTEMAEKFLLSHHCLMAIDESTTIKSTTASRTKNILKLRKLAKYRRILTGSPVTKSPLDLFTQCYFLDPYLLDFQSYYSFKSRYAVLKRQHMGSHSFDQIIGYQRLDELNHKLNQFSFRVLKKDCLDLPEKVYTKRYVTMTTEQNQIYDQMKNHALSHLKTGEVVTAASALAQMIKLHQITCGHITTDLEEHDIRIQEIPHNRINVLKETLQEVDGKIIIWATYIHDIQKIKETLEEEYGVNSVETFFGGTASDDRQEIVGKFQDMDSELRFLVANPRVGGYGLTLTASHTVIYYSNNYDLEVRMQSEDRAHRIGQVNKVTYIDLMVEKTVDELIIKSLRNKINLASQVLGEEFKKWLV
jgi:SNF2 family DNA or RNA helicase|tara:strand:- start:1178 stop:2629 length:1452 start_codon:yes stop_codon:yes gene_type:complete